MTTQGEARANLETILSRLGPGAWLTVDDRWLWACFGSGGHIEADRFAKSKGACFISEGEGGRFGRAYFGD
jgi:hypothetical protein